MENIPSPVHLPEISKEAFEKEGYDDIQFIKTQLNVNLSFVTDKQLILSHIVQQLQIHQENCHNSIVELLQAKKGDLLSFSQKLEKIKRHITILEELYAALFNHIRQQSSVLGSEFAEVKRDITELQQIRQEQSGVSSVLVLHSLLKGARGAFAALGAGGSKGIM